MLPEWMKKDDVYVPPGDGGTFAVKTIRAVGKAMAGIKIQAGHEKERHLPAGVKLILLLVMLILTSVCMRRLVLLAIAAAVLMYLCTWPAGDLWGILKSACAAALMTAVLFLPAMLLQPAGRWNHITVIGKVFLCVCMVNIFNHTTQWNHVTLALRRCHIPGIFVFILDITLKYIVQLGNLVQELLTSMLLRSVGKHRRRYSSVGGVMGVVFIRGMEMNGQMYEAMRCRGFTDDYEGL